MPLFEEKLISPFAVHYSQDHIRPVFQNGGDIEDTIQQIKTKPGIGDYDVVLVAPFPDIEIVKRHQRTSGARVYHWISLDNRRLYCLQRAAAALWPQRVGMVVEALYAATDGIRKKENSSTGGLTVGIGHSPKQLIYRWDWREALRLGESGPRSEAAYDLIALDEQRLCIEELLDAPAPPSMLELYFQGSSEQVELKTADKNGGNAGSDISTADPSTPRSACGSNGECPNPTGTKTATVQSSGTNEKRQRSNWQKKGAARAKRAPARKWAPVGAQQNSGY